MSPAPSIAHFESLYRRADDPWRFATSAYEAFKYDRTLEALGARRYRRALEVGCSIGVFTERLAGLCDDLVAVDVSPTALRRARQRLRGLPHVHVQQRKLPEQTPPGPFDLIVCSEVLYYWPPARLAQAQRAFEQALAPGGSLLSVHWRGRAASHALSGDQVHRRLLANTRLEPAVAHCERRFRLDRLDRTR
ncbi:MAG: hypothetical protein DLM63_04910 [Solirubrobacterales bacterium]|nr:MAG: hypothetical protein DLM63_04910 [Solirubrobacterales bacterium]